MYALVYAAKGPFVLYKIYNISFEHGNDPPPPLLNIVKKTALFLHGGLPKCALKMQLLILLAHQKFESLCPTHAGPQKKVTNRILGAKAIFAGMG